MPKQVLVTWNDTDGSTRAYALGPADDVDAVREEARYHRDAYLVERAAFGEQAELPVESVALID